MNEGVHYKWKMRQMKTVWHETNRQWQKRTLWTLNRTWCAMLNECIIYDSMEFIIYNSKLTGLGLFLFFVIFFFTVSADMNWKCDLVGCGKRAEKNVCRLSNCTYIKWFVCACVFFFSLLKLSICIQISCFHGVTLNFPRHLNLIYSFHSLCDVQCSD